MTTMEAPHAHPAGAEGAVAAQHNALAIAREYAGRAIRTVTELVVPGVHHEPSIPTSSLHDWVTDKGITAWQDPKKAAQPVPGVTLTESNLHKHVYATMCGPFDV